MVSWLGFFKCFVIENNVCEIPDGGLGVAFYKFMNFSIRKFEINEVFNGST